MAATQTVQQSVDIVIVGGGHAGLCAAITAAGSKARILLLEVAPQAMRGGNSRHTRNLRAAHSSPTATMGGIYSQTEYLQDLLKVTSGNTNQSLARLMIDESESLLVWLGKQGVAFQKAISGSLNLESTNAFFLGGGKALLNALYGKAQALGVRVLYEANVVCLEVENNRFEGLVYEHKGQQIHLSAEAVILTSGGFQANKDWMKSAWGDAAENFLIRGTPYNKGLPLKEMIRHQAKLTGDAKQCHAVAIDARAPRYDGGIVSRLDCVSFGIVVNNRALRFYDEGEDYWPKRYAIWGRLVAQQPGQIAFAILDSKTEGLYIPSLYPPISANDISTLAGLLEIDPIVLNRTVSQFNNSTNNGLFQPESRDGLATHNIEPRKSNWALPLDTPPYLAFPLRPGITFTYLGLEVNSKAMAKNQSGHPFENVFAAGEIMAGNILGEGYCAGTGMTIGGVFGRIAGRQAAACL
ncbi:MAG: FAD-dependent tricarballylate dehydrogenase TcuA [Gammaproteobacteria bacterium]|jgi:tricarballylate dehydrogenase|nr:FAD-dependent tricarballylate dehydrogenase TcuA [Gammaproteobacteria bacterium]MBT5204581.1 FAD-dependent tricarballylate dehydrogenase TcuA [Gammaproteobacteria bacterium]MBT5602888.1 FAD-dependent tricarballylate dehydrogenase TcuA [Gammaproteobacteria bacterium]MBT6244719.1 FAD-dependent tricarballylate dehydrogenase TcuA [Gammaproteobacteria bacterium]